MSKKKKRREKKSPSPPTAQSKTEATDSSMSIDGILAQLSSLADNSRSFITGYQGAGAGAWHTERTANAPDRRAADEGGIMQELWCGNRMD